MCTLLDVVNGIDAAEREHTIYVAEPWTHSSTAVVAADPGARRIPAEAAEVGGVYFLEVFLAADLIADVLATSAEKPSSHELCQHLIRYAIHDA